MVDIALRRLDPGLPPPSYAHPGDAGADLFTTVDVTLQPGERAMVPTGIALALPEGYVALVHPRSGLAARHGVSIVNTPGTVDAGYRGEIKVLLVNLDPATPVTLLARRPDRPARRPALRDRVVRRGRRTFPSRNAAPGVTVQPEGSPHRHPDRRRSAREVRPQGSTGARRRRRRRRGRDCRGGSRIEGPHDADGLDLEDNPAFANHIDLGGLVLAPPPAGVELRLQVDEESETVLAVLLATEEGALELRPFAASRHGDLWSEVRPQIAAETARRGGTADEQQGPFGTELRCMVPVQTTGGASAAQPSRVIGVNGPRWFLRATLIGRPAVEEEAAKAWEDVLREGRGAPRRGRDASWRAPGAHASPGCRTAA